jgi:hypothetical protein
MPAPTDRLPDVRSLIYEIERLRCAAMELREATDDVMNNAWKDGAREERQNVVAFLRAEANEPHPIEAGERALSPSGRGLLMLNASRIERGEHRREETK